MRRLKRVVKRQPGEFRLLLRIGIDGVRTPEEALMYAAGVNLVRFKRHVAKVQHRLYWDQPHRKIKVQARRRRRTLELKAQGSGV